MLNKKIETKTEDILLQVGDMTDSLVKRAKRVNFTSNFLSKDEIVDLRMYLGYTKSFSDLAKVRLLYHKVSVVKGVKKHGKK